MSRRRRKHRAEAPPFTDLETALDIIDDDLPDGAYWALLEEMTGMDPGEVAEAIERKERNARRTPGATDVQNR